MSSAPGLPPGGGFDIERVQAALEAANKISDPVIRGEAIEGLRAVLRRPVEEEKDRIAARNREDIRLGWGIGLSGGCIAAMIILAMLDRLSPALTTALGGGGALGVVGHFLSRGKS